MVYTLHNVFPSVMLSIINSTGNVYYRDAELGEKGKKPTNFGIKLPFKLTPKRGVVWRSTIFMALTIKFYRPKTVLNVVSKV